jgi:histidine triad (HIT) family protein
MASIFTKIINGEIPCYKVYEDDLVLAFLDINPVKRGHTLVIPKREENLLFDLSDKEYDAVMNTAKRIAKSIKANINCKRVSMAVVGLEVPHAHVHLIPLDKMDDFSFKNEKVKMSHNELTELALALAESF